MSVNPRCGQSPESDVRNWHASLVCVLVYMIKGSSVQRVYTATGSRRAKRLSATCLVSQISERYLANARGGASVIVVRMLRPVLHGEVGGCMPEASHSLMFLGGRRLAGPTGNLQRQVLASHVVAQLNPSRDQLVTALPWRLEDLPEYI
ncbi:hypothetical protein VOLCADRAFT_104936 [Volvox carteri f. nagariensis]|uniref:Uncharacterized protein n=1 Tax=Volvox carteri f. nagariensis TaxID=3068 RepID=D8TX84_VOLCA|nr:uncharacterized protein VOLCADRAFT_104936 [Volvox carteri f. nagariensis]EFJ47866.1 hypothetical protein VOLCADRAFT_104936 [Volvox carteri f. nagariensis]|eukprot:XP_002950972.1 hypothetical protein VOLCADRAFT_104936 [Volvox carteri f. nagariensis]